MKNELRFGHRIRQALNRSAAELPPATLERLRAAREQALAARRAEQPAFELAPSAAESSWGGAVRNLGGFSLRWLAPAAVLVAGLSAIYVWQQSYRVAEVEEVDTRLLTDELPIDAYLDKGFQAWLKKQNASGQ